ncbi:hypothetical protein I6F35_12245 [Bradyrhizobium sp. BRP22]|uniref:hypothetical protein n=1 Tax=Bradyrhizobium sp. BRP22 TaxID=2793821 RepID=UPI001CD1CB0B|nr:hypothetical protein [Bradyrhizobium sp. BRP22]MCA1453982.1 hypothetical protein [Bradyrhizobium sp. BRP22]
MCRFSPKPEQLFGSVISRLPARSACAASQAHTAAPSLSQILFFSKAEQVEHGASKWRKRFRDQEMAVCRLPVGKRAASGTSGTDDGIDMNHANQTLTGIVATVNMIRRFAIEVARDFDDDHLAVVEQALRSAADAVARERAIERCLIDDWAGK